MMYFAFNAETPTPDSRITCWSSVGIMCTATYIKNPLIDDWFWDNVNSMAVLDAADNNYYHYKLEDPRLIALFLLRFG